MSVRDVVAYLNASYFFDNRLFPDGPAATGHAQIALSPLILASLLAVIIAGIVTTDIGLVAFTRLVANVYGVTDRPRVPGCKKLGISKERSHLLHDEFDPKYRRGDVGGEGRTWKIKSLWIYPVKSCAGIELESSTVLGTGLAYDRAMSFGQRSEKDTTWKFSTARSHPLLTQVTTELWIPDLSAADFAKDLQTVRTGGVIRLVFPHPAPSRMQRLVAALQGRLQGPTLAAEIPLQPTTEDIGTKYPIEPFTIWGETVGAINMSRHMPPELVRFLGTVKAGSELALFRSHELRDVYRDAPRREQLGWQVVAGFNDAYPVNLVGLSSLQATEELQETARQMVLAEKGRDYGPAPRLGARRFRANVIVEGAPEFEEETWKYIRLGHEEFHVVARCVRCKLPNVHPDTGVAHRSFPDVAIRKLRQVDRGAPKNTGCLAVQMVPKNELGGSIHVGDAISVTQRGEHCYIPMGI